MRSHPPDTPLATTPDPIVCPDKPILLVAAFSANTVSIGPTRYGDGIACWVFRIGEDVSIGLMHGTEREPAFGSQGAKRTDILHIENQLGDGLTIFAPTSQGMKHDVASGVGGTFQLDDAIAFFPVNAEVKMKRVEFGDGVDVADVEQNSTKDGRGMLLGHHTVRVACQGNDLIGQHRRVDRHLATVACQAKEESILRYLDVVKETIR